MSGGSARHGWWRRNRWGLIALIPVLAATIGLNVGDVYDTYWKGKPREPVKPGADGWVSFGGARMRLADLAPAADLQTFGGKAFTPPGGSAVWKATLAFDTAKPDSIGGCDIELEDSSGRTFGANPSELTSTEAGFASCLPDFGAAKTAKYQTVAYFVTPSSARPSAIRITLRTQLPRYARLSH
jgi:hypothetical protein